MSAREEAIIREVRITLNDTVKLSLRWTDERLVELLSNGQDDFCRNMPMIVRKTTVNAVGGVEEYRLPLDCVKLLTATANRNSLNLVAYDEIERDNTEWEDDKASYFSSVVVNALAQQTIRPYPILSEGLNLPIKVRFQAMPVRLGWITDNNPADPNAGHTENELTISSMWDYGLTQYVISMAFLDYGDQSSSTRAATAAGLYNKEYARAKQLSKKGFAKRGVTTNYRAKVASDRKYGYRGGNNGFSNNGFRY